MGKKSTANKPCTDTEQMLVELLDTATFVVILFDIDGTIVTLNQFAADRIGKSRSELIGSSDCDLYPPEVVDYKKGLFDEVIRTGKLLTVEDTHGIRHYETTLSPIFDDKGKVRRIILYAYDITERDRAEEELAASETNYRTIFNSSSDAIFIHDMTTGAILDVNRRMCEMFGYTHDEVVNLTVNDLSLGKLLFTQKEAVDWIKKAKTQGPQTFEWISKRRNGEAFWADVTLARATIAGQERIIATVRDITARKKVEEALQDREERYRNLFEESPISLWEEDFSEVKTYIDELRSSGVKNLREYFENHPEAVDHCATMIKVIRVNKATLDLYAAESIEEFRNGLNKIFGETSYETFKEELIALAEGETRFETETTTRTLKGEDKHIILNWSIAPDHEKTLSKVLVSILDVTKSKLAEAALQQSEIKYRALFESMLDGFALHEMIFDENNKPVDYRFLEVNPAFEKMTGLSAKEIVGKTALAVMPDTEAHWIETYGAVVQTGIPHRFENYAAELKKYFEVLAYQTEPNRFATVFIDITNRKLLEEQLHQSEKMRVIGQLAGGIAHDFNNQLAGVMGYADMLEYNLKDERLSRYAGNIKKGAKRAAELTAQLLAFSRKGKNLSIPVEIHRILADVYSILEHSIDKRITMLKLLKASPATTLGDPSQIQNAILNIALNARDAMPTGGELIFETGIVELSKEFCKDHPYKLLPGRFIKIGITDSGCGMDAETQRHIYEPFFTTKDVGKGTGMGLASAYGTIRNHKGAINVYSEVEHGTTFSIYLPLVEEIRFEPENLVRNEPIKGTARILLVDDEEIVLSLGADMLRELGYKVTLATNGKEAVELYKKSWEKIDLVILDMVMPELGGRDAFVAMHKINPSIKAILSSGYSINGEAQAILNEGVLAFVGKPYDHHELSKKVAHVLKMRK